MKKYRVASLLVLTLFVIAANASSTITSKTYQAEVGQYRKTAENGLEVRDGGNNPAGSSQGPNGTGANCTENVTMTGAGENATTSITAGDLVYALRLTVKPSPSPPGNTCFVVTTAYNGVDLASLYVRTSSAPQAGDFVLCMWDLNVTSMPALYTIGVSVRQYP